MSQRVRSDFEKQMKVKTLSTDPTAMLLGAHFSNRIAPSGASDPFVNIKFGHYRRAVIRKRLARPTAAAPNLLLNITLTRSWASTDYLVLCNRRRLRLFHGLSGREMH